MKEIKKISLYLLVCGVVLIMQNCTRQPDLVNHHDMTPVPADTIDYADRVNSGSIKIDTMKGSPSRQAMVTVGDAHIHLTYRSPGVKGRVIWGGLVPYGQIWAAGAHHPTHFRTNRPLKFADKDLPAGEYALFLIPGKSLWRIVVNSDYNQHMTDNYKMSRDLIRFELAPVRNSGIVPRLTYTVLKQSESSGFIKFEWEKIVLKIPFELTKNP